MKRTLSFLISLSVSFLTFSTLNSDTIRAGAKEAVEVKNLRSEYEKHYDNGDGTLTAYISSVPIHYWNNDRSEWVNIDNSLVLDKDGNYVNQSNPFGVIIPSRIARNGMTDDTDSNVIINNKGYEISIGAFYITSENNGLDAVSESGAADSNTYSEALVQQSGDDDLRAMDIPYEVAEAFDKAVSCVEYDSVYGNIDFSVEVHPDFVSESIEFDNKDSVPESLTYCIKAEGLSLNTTENNEVFLVDSNGAAIYEISAPVMTDSSYYSDSIRIESEIAETDEGYIITVYPGTYFDEADDTEYPLTLNSRYSTQVSPSTYYNSQRYSSQVIKDSVIRVGYNHHKSYVTGSFEFLNGNGNNITINEAKLNMYSLGISTGTTMPIKIYSMPQTTTEYSWSTDPGESSYVLTGSFNAQLSDMYSWIYADITPMVQAWTNYVNTSGVAGIPGYIMKMYTDSNYTGTFTAYSERSASKQPYFTINYSSSNYNNAAKYRLDYTPYKYDNLTYQNNQGTIYNFQNRMNCYAYALQVYYTGSLNSNQVYLLKPGEFGISYNNSISNYQGLCQGYSSFSSPDTNYMDFVEDRMEEDGMAIGFSLSRISTSNGFALPNNFNENNERIIAMVVGNAQFGDIRDYHFYVRDGNGTCPNGHGGNCSAWSHKRASEKISNVTIDQDSHYDHPYLCDANIDTYACQGNYSASPEIRYYTITKDTNLYNSSHGYGHDNSSTGTPYYS